MKKDAAAYKTNGDGSKHLRGYWVVDKDDNLVLLAPSAKLGEGMRYATPGDHARKEAAEAARAELEANPPPEPVSTMDALLQRISAKLDELDARTEPGEPAPPAEPPAT